MYSHKNIGTCSSRVDFDIENGVITQCHFTGGCTGNTQAVERLAVGRKAQDVIRLLRGIQCQNGTSCPDQLAQALEQWEQTYGTQR